jgi:hypothetical protein
MLTFIIVVLVVLLILAGPVMVGARVVGAGRTSFGACLGALVVSNVIVALATVFFHRLGLLAIFVAPLGYMWVLDTTYLRALAIEAIQFAIMVGLVFILAMTAVGTSMHLRDIFQHLETGPAQSV